MSSQEAPRVLVFAYSDVGYDCLELLLKHGAEVVGVFTHEDNPNEEQWFRCVADLAASKGIPVFKPKSLKDEAVFQGLKDLRPDIIFSFYYRNMIPEAVLDLPSLGAFNMHGSLLPKYRGRAPVNWAVLHGETQIGATLHTMVKQADAGDMIDQEAVSIGPRETAFEVMRKVQQAACVVLERQVKALLTGTAPRIPQDDSQATYFSGRKPEDGRIDWTQSAQSIFNLIRAVTHPFPGAFTDAFENKRLCIWWAEPEMRFQDKPSSDFKPGECVSQEPLMIATGDGFLKITECEWQDLPASANAN
tara:strand:+ start:12312 stop:13223 length:912 start_codon:yes stop_codon:yes gene_type:complete